MIIVLGSCRVNLNYQDLNLYSTGKNIGYIHSLSEHIQLIKLLKKEINIPENIYKYIFTLAGGKQRINNFEKNLQLIMNKNLIEKSSIFVIEVCSINNYQYKDYFFQKSRWLGRSKWGIEEAPLNVINNVNHYKSDEIMFKNYFLELINLLQKKTIIFVGTPNFFTKLKEKIPERVKINELLKKYVKYYNDNGFNLYFIDYTEVITYEDQIKYIKDDLTHHTKIGHERLKNIITTIINNII